MTQHTRGAWRPLASVAAVAAAGASGLTAGLRARHSRRWSAGDCADPFPVARPGRADPVDRADRVARAPTPDGFTGEVIGVLNDGIAPGAGHGHGAAHLARDRPRRQSGRACPARRCTPRTASLIGAVAYGLSYGPVPGRRGDAVRGDGRLSRHPRPDGQGAGRCGATDRAPRRTSPSPRPSRASRSCRCRWASPASAPRAWRTSRRRPTWTRARAPWASLGRPQGPTAETIVAGGNLALSAAYGEVTIAAVGTVTSVCDDRVVGFGHPATFLGKITAGLHPADAVYVQEDRVAWASRWPTSVTRSARSPTTTRPGSPGRSGTCRRPRPSPRRVTYGARSRIGSERRGDAELPGQHRLLPAGRQPRPGRGRPHARVGGRSPGRSPGPVPT